MTARCAFYLSAGILSLHLTAHPLPAQVGSNALEAVRVALEHVEPRPPEGRVALHFDYVVGEGVAGTDSIRWIRPYKLIAPGLRAPALAALGAVPFSRETLRWCEYGEDGEVVATPDCFTATVLITAPEIAGNEARMAVVVHTDQASHERRFEFLLTRSNDRWSVAEVREFDLWY